VKKRAMQLGHEAAMEKYAFLGALRGLYRGVRALGTGGMGRVGKALTSSVEKFSPRAAGWLARAGQDATTPMWQFGGLMGGIGALTNPEDRFRGFAGGALGGLGWQAGGNLARAAMLRGATKLGPKALKAYESVGSRQLFRPLSDFEKGLKSVGGKVPGSWARRTFGAGREMTGAQAAKLLGAKSAIGAVPLAASLGGSELMPSFGGAPQQAYPQQAYPQQAYYPQEYYQKAAAAILAKHGALGASLTVTGKGGGINLGKLQTTLTPIKKDTEAGTTPGVPKGSADADQPKK